MRGTILCLSVVVVTVGTETGRGVYGQNHDPELKQLISDRDRILAIKIDVCDMILKELKQVMGDATAKSCRLSFFIMENHGRYEPNWNLTLTFPSTLRYEYVKPIWMTVRKGGVVIGRELETHGNIEYNPAWALWQGKTVATFLDAFRTKYDFVEPILEVLIEEHRYKWQRSRRDVMSLESWYVGRKTPGMKIAWETLPDAVRRSGWGRKSQAFFIDQMRKKYGNKVSQRLSSLTAK